MKNTLLRSLLGYSLISALVIAPASVLAKSPNAHASVKAQANASASVHTTADDCPQAFGHLIAPGWIKHNGTTTVDPDCVLPAGIAKKLTSPPEPPATTTPDTTPDTFAFVDLAAVATSTVIESNAITVAGINAATAISVTGGEYSVNGGAYATTSGTVNAGDTVKVRHTSSASYSTSAHTTLTIGGVSDTFTTTTMVAPDLSAPIIFVVTSTAGTSTATVTWFTTESADAQVAYGTTTAYGSVSALDTDMTFFHSVTLTGLAADTTYHFQVMSKDAAGNLAVSSDGSFTTDPLPDTAAPVISSVGVSGIGSTTAMVSWTTDEPATSKVYFASGTTLDLATATALVSTALTTTHVMTLDGLTASTTYSFAVQSSDAAGNTATSATSSFATGL